MRKFMAAFFITFCLLSFTIMSSFAAKLNISNKPALTQASREDVAKGKSEEQLIRDTVTNTVKKVVTPMLVQVELSGVNAPANHNNIMTKVKISCKKITFGAGDKECKVKCKNFPYSQYEFTVFGDEYTGAMGIGWANRKSIKELLEYAVETENFECGLSGDKPR